MSRSRWEVNESGVLEWDAMYLNQRVAVNRALELEKEYGGKCEVVRRDRVQLYPVWVIENRWLNSSDVEHSSYCRCEKCVPL